METICIILITAAAYYLPILFSYLEGNARGAREYRQWWKNLLEPGRGD